MTPSSYLISSHPLISQGQDGCPALTCAAPRPASGAFARARRAHNSPERCSPARAVITRIDYRHGTPGAGLQQAAAEVQTRQPAVGWQWSARTRVAQNNPRALAMGQCMARAGGGGGGGSGQGVAAAIANGRDGEPTALPAEVVVAAGARAGAAAAAASAASAGRRHTRWRAPRRSGLCARRRAAVMVHNKINGYSQTI